MKHLAEDKKYKTLAYIGLALILISVLFNDAMSMTYQFGLFGFALGWISAVFVLRRLIIKEGMEESKKNEIDNVIEEHKELSENQKSKENKK